MNVRWHGGDEDGVAVPAARKKKKMCNYVFCDFVFHCFSALRLLIWFVCFVAL
jgi:hypothetical protein